MININIDIGNTLTGLGTILIAIGTLRGKPKTSKKKKKHKNQ